MHHRQTWCTTPRRAKAPSSLWISAPAHCCGPWSCPRPWWPCTCWGLMVSGGKHADDGGVMQPPPDCYLISLVYRGQKVLRWVVVLHKDGVLSSKDILALVSPLYDYGTFLEKAIAWWTSALIMRDVFLYPLNYLNIYNMEVHGLRCILNHYWTHVNSYYLYTCINIYMKLHKY